MPSVFHIGGNPIYVNTDDKLPDMNVLVHPPGNICSFRLLVDNFTKGLYDGREIVVWCNSDTLLNFESYLEVSERLRNDLIHDGKCSIIEGGDCDCKGTSG